MARAMRQLVPFEVIAILALAIAPLPEMVPISLPLLVVATISKWIRGRDWAEVVHGGWFAAGIGAAVGLVALLLALVIGTPVIEALANRAVEWSTWPIVRGSAMQAVIVAVIVIASAVAAELALRGWIVERVLELARPGPMANALAVATGALAEAMLVDGDFAARLGGAAFGAGLGGLYVAAGRSVVPGLCARIAFALGALVLEAARWIG